MLHLLVRTTTPHLTSWEMEQQELHTVSSNGVVRSDQALFIIRELGFFYLQSFINQSINRSLELFSKMARKEEKWH